MGMKSKPKKAPALKTFKVSQPKLGKSNAYSKKGQFHSSKPIKANTINKLSSPRQMRIGQMKLGKSRGMK